MPTKDQYEFFRQSLTEEDSRNGILVKRGEIYLSLVSLFLTGLIFKLSDLKTYFNNNYFNKIVFTLILICLFGSTVFTMLSLRIRNYTGLDLSKWSEELGEEPPTDTEFYENRIADFIAVSLKNKDINNRRGVQLIYAGYFLLVSILLVSVLLFSILIL